MRRTLVNIIRISVLLSSILLVSGCGGHGGGGHRHPAPSVHVTLSSPSVSEELAAGDEIPVNVDGSWSGTNVQSREVFLDVRDTADDS